MILKGITAVSAVYAALQCMMIRLTAMPLAVLFLLNFVGCFVVLAVAAVAFLFAVCALVDLEKPQEQDSIFYRAVMYLYIELLINVMLVRVHTSGLEKTPKEGRFLLVCNHLFLADPGVLLHCFRKSQLAFISKKENMDMPIINKFMHKILCQMLERDNDRQALKVILKCIQLIKDDLVSVGVFPEGYTSKDGKLHPFRSGVFKIAQKTGVPIVVCTIQGTREIFRNVKKLNPTDVHLHLVDVIPGEELKGKSTVEVGEQVYEMMISDLGEEWRYTEE